MSILLYKMASFILFGFISVFYCRSNYFNNKHTSINKKEEININSEIIELDNLAVSQSQHNIVDNKKDIVENNVLDIAKENTFPTNSNQFRFNQLKLLYSPRTLDNTKYQAYANNQLVKMILFTNFRNMYNKTELNNKLFLSLNNYKEESIEELFQFFDYKDYKKIRVLAKRKVLYNKQ